MLAKPKAVWLFAGWLLALVAGSQALAGGEVEAPTVIVSSLTAGPMPADQSKASMIVAVDAVGRQDKDITAGIWIQLAPEFKTYWRDPGDAGFAFSLEWLERENIASWHQMWPAPSRFNEYGLETIGYDGDVVLPLVITLEQAGQAVSGLAKINYLICRDICIPQEQIVQLDLTTGVSKPSAWSDLIDRFMALVPVTDSRIKATGAWDEHGMSVNLSWSPDVDWMPGAADVFIETNPLTAFAPPTITVDSQNRTLRAVFDLQYSNEIRRWSAAVLNQIRITVVDGNGAFESSFLADKAMPSLGWILILALLGGAILNVMPCVLPVLSLKLMSLVQVRQQAQGQDCRQARRAFLWSVAGIFTFFLVLALILIVVHALGQVPTWGMHFQQPIFLTVMAAVLTAFSMSLIGWLPLQLPTSLTTSMAALAQGEKNARHFAHGALAVLLATPCSAPFLGAAVGFALHVGGWHLLLIFTALALGFSLPWLIIAACPSMIHFLPKPGRWMKIISAILSVGVGLTVVWIMLVAYRQIGLIPVTALALALVLAVGMARQGWRQAWGMMALGVILALWLPRALPANDSHSLWQPFDPLAIPMLVDAGAVVIVDITADWCLTCKVNNIRVLDRDPTKARLFADDIVAQRGDWTRPDETITNWLTGFGRYGIPFIVVFGPNAQRGIVLPELLSHQAINQAIDQAAGSIAVRP